MKRYIILSALALCLFLTACGGGQTAQTSQPTTAPVTASQPTTPPAPMTETPKAETAAQPSQQEEPAAEPEEPAEEPPAPQKSYTNPKKFSIEGKWKNVGSYTFGQVQSNAIVVFDGTYCNVFSPQDTYAFYKDGDDFRLDCTSFLFSDTLSFTVKIVDKNNIDIYNGTNYLELTKVE